MEIVTSIVVQSVLLGVAFLVTLLRCWIRLRMEHRALTLPDYLVWGGWLFALGWVICSVRALNIQIDHPLEGEDLLTDSVDYLKTVYVSCFFFEFGLYFPKASLVAFFWWLIPPSLRGLRIGVYVTTAFVASAFVATLFTDILIAGKVSNNWSIENQLLSTWNSYPALISNWILNVSTDILLFALPFFLIKDLKLRRRQTIGLVGIFCLGLITIAISLARFLVYIVSDFSASDASGNAWCTAEMCIATIVVSLPSLKAIVRSTSVNSSYPSTKGYKSTGPRKPTLRSQNQGVSRTDIRAGEDEIGLVLEEWREGSTTTTTDAVSVESQKAKGMEYDSAVVVRTDVTISRDSGIRFGDGVVDR